MLVPFSQMWCLSKPDIDGFFCLAKFYKFSIKKVKDRLSFTFLRSFYKKYLNDLIVFVDRNRESFVPILRDLGSLTYRGSLLAIQQKLQAYSSSRGIGLCI